MKDDKGLDTSAYSDYFSISSSIEEEDMIHHCIYPSTFILSLANIFY